MIMGKKLFELTMGMTDLENFWQNQNDSPIVVRNRVEGVCISLYT